MNDQLLNAVAALGDKYAEAAQLQVKLNLSLLLAKVEPRAFSHGQCRTKVVGNIKHNVEDAKFIVVLGSGEEIVHKLLDVPYDLWGESAKLEYLSLPRHERKRFDKVVARVAA